MTADTPHPLTKLLIVLFRNFSGRRRKQLLILLFLMVCSSALEVMSISSIIPFLGALTSPSHLFELPRLQPIIQFLNIQSPDQLLIPFTILFCLASLVAAIVRLLTLWVQARVGHSISSDLSTAIFDTVLHQPFSVHAQRNSSEIVVVISERAHEAVQLILMPILTIINGSLILLAIVTLLIWLGNPFLIISCALVLFIIYGTLVVFTKPLIRRHGLQIDRLSVLAHKTAQEGLGGIRDIILTATQDIFLNIYDRSNRLVRRSQANVLIIGNFPRFLIEPLSLLAIASAAIYITDQTGDITSWIPAFGALALGAQRLLPVLQQLYSSLSSIRGGQQSLQRIVQLLSQDYSVPLVLNYGRPLPLLKNAIVLNDVSFKHPQADKFVLSNINLTIPWGSKIGIIGETGGGKSTLIDIVMALIEPTTGKVLVDGVCLSTVNPRAWQSQIAHVPQSVFLSDGTIAENVAFGVAPNQIDMGRVIDALQRSQLWSTVSNLPDGLDTRVGERGVRLSGGQRQRIGIARALYRQAKVMIFDEATSALDEETENAVMGAIDAIGDGLTLIMVAHRLKTLRNCSAIIKVSDGTVKFVDRL